ncbi:MAG: hypothetical protein IPI67_39505 [Myxococcales bacterium]|nr:hypothetical protein [Myxococcales bacterium]
MEAAFRGAKLAAIPNGNMARSASASRRFAGSLLLSSVIHTSLFVMLATGGSVTARDLQLYEIEIEPEPPRAAVAAAPEAPPPSEARDESAEPGAGGPAPLPGAVNERHPAGPRVNFQIGANTPIGNAAVPPAAQAGRVLAVEGEGDVVDFTMVQGSAGRYAGGLTASSGTSETKVTDPRATGAGMAPRNAVTAGPATTKPAAAHAAQTRPPPSQASSARPVVTAWSCAFPPQADVDQIHFARVLVAVTVHTDGHALAVTVLSDPGHGFGASARACALGQRFRAARDAAGRPITATTPPFHVTFTR